ncbi:unnamed protein product, partial [Rotaria sordida]
GNIYSSSNLSDSRISVKVQPKDLKFSP